MSRPLYPWLLCLYPIALLYSQNLGIVHDGEVLVSSLASLATTTALYGLLRLLTGNAHKSALTTALAVVVFFSAGHLAAIAQAADGGEIASLAVPALLYGAAAVLVVVWHFVSDEHAGTLNLLCNFVALLLLVTPGFSISRHGLLLMAREDGQIIAVGEKPERVPKISDSPSHPDVYFIIVDGYSSNAQLAREFAYDNSRFTDSLEAMGFTVAYDSKSSYGATLHSLASTLNLRHITENTAAPGVDDMSYMHILIADNLIARMGIEHGYTYLHMLSGLLLPSSIADVNLNFGPSGTSRHSYVDLAPDLHHLDKKSITNGEFLKRSFYPFLAETTFLYPFSEEIRTALQDHVHAYSWSDHRRFPDTLAAIEAIADRPEATFTFAHLLEPHGPVQVNRAGKKVARTWEPTAEQFFDELEFVNDRLLETLQALLERSKNPPIIILQADHGTTLGRVWTDAETLTNFEILNAVYVPEPSRIDIARDESPINSWRAVLNVYFGGDFEPLEPRYFDLPNGYEDPFVLVDVTERFR